MRYFCRSCAFLGLVLVAFSVAAAERVGPPLVLAQDESDDSMIEWGSTPVKITLLVAGFLAAAVFAKYVVFEMLVRNLRWWPLSAYGFSLGFVILATSCCGAYLFNQPLKQLMEGAGGTWKEFAPHSGIVAAAFLAAIVVGFVFRSEKGRSAGRSS